MTDFAETVQQYVRERMAHRAAVLEDLCAQAMILQDYDQLDRLQVIYQDGCEPAVASELVAW